MTNKSRGKRRKKKNVTDDVSEAANNEGKIPPGYV
jgi:hypothetical protein